MRFATHQLLRSSEYGVAVDDIPDCRQSKAFRKHQIAFALCGEIDLLADPPNFVQKVKHSQAMNIKHKVAMNTK